MVDPNALFHVAIKVDDVPQAVEFYRTHLNGDVVSRRRADEANPSDPRRVEYAALDVADKLVYVVERPPYEAADLVDELPAGFLHFGYVVDDLEAAAASLRADGVEFLMEPTEYGDHSIAFFHAPGGVRIELLEPRE